MTSLLEVATRAGVSASTASRVLANKPYPVSEAIRGRVLKAASELNYHPNASARTLATGYSRFIGLIVGNILDPYFAEIARGVEDQSRRAGHLTMVCNADRSLRTEAVYLQSLREHRARGVIFAGGALRGSRDADELNSAVEEALADGVTVVCLAERDFRMSALITVDNHTAAYDITNYLISLGHRRIAFVSGPANFTISDLRTQGYLAALADADIQPLPIHPGGFTYESGRSATAHILRDGLPDAVLAADDVSGVGVLMALREAGVRVPLEVSVAAIDGTSHSEFVDLTTVMFPMYALGASAAQRILNGPSNGTTTQMTLPHRVAARGSTTPRHEDGATRAIK